MKRLARAFFRIARLFMRLKVIGEENIRRDGRPAVFVCNHSMVFGPLSAMSYMPVPVRPWIHDVMLDRALAEKELDKSMAVVKKILGRSLGGALLRWAAGVLCRAMDTYRPIPVVRGVSRDGAATFEKSLAALLEGDNLLIFPEKPRAVSQPQFGKKKKYDASILRPFYTGFALIGKMYHDATGEDLLFYPVCSDRKRRRLTIAPPIAYDSTLDSRESKQRLSDSLRAAILQMKEEES